MTDWLIMRLKMREKRKSPQLWWKRDVKSMWPCCCLIVGDDVRMRIKRKDMGGVAKKWRGNVGWGEGSDCHSPLPLLNMERGRWGSDDGYVYERVVSGLIVGWMFLFCLFCWRCCCFMLFYLQQQMTHKMMKRTKSKIQTGNNASMTIPTTERPRFLTPAFS